MEDGSLLRRQLGIENFDTRYAMGRRASLLRLSVAADVDIADLEAIAYRRDDRGFTFFREQRINDSLLARTGSNRCLCPECLVESAYHRAAWDLSFFSACPVHKRQMVCSCPDCGEQLRWRGVDLLRCGCSKEDLSRFRSPAIEAGSLDGLEVATGLLGDGRFEAQAHRARLIGPFRSISPMAIVEFIFRLGMDLTPGPRRMLFSLQKPASLDTEPHAALHRGLAAARNWPGSLDAVLTAITAKSPDEPFGTLRLNWFKAYRGWLNTLPFRDGGHLWTAYRQMEEMTGVRITQRGVTY